MEEKNLIKKENSSIFQRIRVFLKKLFNKDVDNEIIQKSEKNIINKLNIIDDIKEKEKILNLQQKYEAEKILESDMSEEEKRNLEELYKQQIKALEYNINEYNNKLKKYKNQIIEIKKKIKNKKD